MLYVCLSGEGLLQEHANDASEHDDGDSENLINKDSGTQRGYKPQSGLIKDDAQDSIGNAIADSEGLNNNELGLSEYRPSSIMDDSLNKSAEVIDPSAEKMEEGDSMGNGSLENTSVQKHTGPTGTMVRNNMLHQIVYRFLHSDIHI